MNVVYALGCNVVVVVDKDTEAWTTYKCIDIFGEMYPQIRSQLYREDSVVDKTFHTFYRDPKRTLKIDKFYLD